MTFLQNHLIELKLGMEGFSGAGILIPDTILTSKVFGTNRPSSNYDLCLEPIDPAQIMTFLQNHPIELKLGMEGFSGAGILIPDTILTSTVFGTN